MLPSLIIVLIALVIVQRAEIIYYKETATRHLDLLSVSRDLLGNLWEKYKYVCEKKNWFRKFCNKNSERIEQARQDNTIS